METPILRPGTTLGGARIAKPFGTVTGSPLASSKAHLVIPAAFVIWGIINVILSNVAMLIPYGTSFSVVLRNGVVVSGAVWIAIGASRLSIPLRLCAPVVLILLLQAWGAFAAAWLAAAIGRQKDINAADFFILRYLYLYFTASMLVWIDPKYRTWMQGIIFFQVGLVGLVAYAQFLHFGPAIQLAIRLNPEVDITNWDNRGGLRATGLYGYPGHLAINAMFCCAIFVGRILVRKLSKFEIAAFLYFATVSVLPQARTHIPMLGVCVLIFLLGMMYRERANSTWFLIIFAAVVGSFLYFGRNQLQYVLSTKFSNDNNLRYRQEKWKTATLVNEQLPWTGVGPEPRYWGKRDSLPDKFAPKVAFDNGWVLIRSSYGLIGVALVGGAFALALIMSFAVRKDRNEAPERKAMIYTMGIVATGTAIGMYGNNVITWEPTMSFLFMLTGVAMSSSSEGMSSYQRSLHARMSTQRIPSKPNFGQPTEA